MRHVNETILSEQLLSAYYEQLAPYISLVGVSEDALTEPDIEVPESKFIELLEVAAKHGDPNLGLMMGSQADPTYVGALGYATSNAPTLKDALNILSEYIVIYSHFSEINWNIVDEFIEISYHIVDPTILAKRQDAEFAIAIIYRIMTISAGETLSLHKVEFEHKKPTSVELHHKIFNCAIKFSQPVSKLVFNKEILTIQLTGADSRLFSILMAHLKNQKKLREPVELHTQLSNLIAAQLNFGDVSIQHISKLMGVSIRTLQRRLSDNNLDYSLLLNNIRHQLALNYIKDTNLSVLQISEKVGYQETSSFSRAFKRWTAVTPKEYRQLQLDTH
jgi:AraC-like DNA-binding protein